jgi:hypothetical protein
LKATPTRTYPVRAWPADVTVPAPSLVLCNPGQVRPSATDLYCVLEVVSLVYRNRIKLTEFDDVLRAASRPIAVSSCAALFKLDILKQRVLTRRFRNQS